MKKNDNYHGQTRDDMVDFLPNYYNKVLEVGCSEGMFFKQLDSLCEVWGIEPNEKASIKASIKASKFYHRVFNDTFEGVVDKIPDNYFDLVICNDVVEHMVDHNAFFVVIKKKMKINGTLIGSIPNVRHIHNLFNLLILKDWKYQNAGVLDYTHLRFFTEKSLKRVFLENEFSINKIKGINSIFRRRIAIETIIENIVAFLVIVFSFGFFHDTRFVQFGFQVINK